MPDTTNPILIRHLAPRNFLSFGRDNAGMETLIVADRAASREHYKQNLNENPLPHTIGLESRPRHEVKQALETATKNCNNAYAKGKRSFEIFEKLDPEVLRQHLPSFERVVRILNAKL